MKIFFAFAFQDTELVYSITQYIKPSLVKKEIEIWEPVNIKYKEKSAIEIEKNLIDTDIVVFFFSSDLLTSSLFRIIEPELIRRKNNNSLEVIGVLIRPCIWKYTELAKHVQFDMVTREEGVFAKLDEEQNEKIHKLLFKKIDVFLEKRKHQIVSDADRQDLLTTTKELKDTINTEEKLIEKLRDLLHKKGPEAVFDYLDKVLRSNNSELTNFSILLKYRYNRTIDLMNKGIITTENYLIENNKIVESLLNLIQEIPSALKSEGIEFSDEYLNLITKVYGIEEEQKKHEDLRYALVDKDREIDEIIFKMRDLDLENHPEISKEFAHVFLKYEQIKNQDKHPISLESREKELDKIREETLSILNKLKKLQFNEQGEANQEKLKTLDTVLLNEVKLIFIGNEGVGKTTLRQNLITDGAYKLTPHDSTIGLEVAAWSYQTQTFPVNHKIQFNIWDYGGQGKYRAIQQFFCSRRALYIYVTTPLEKVQINNDEYAGLDYWLEFVRLFGHDPGNNQYSPVIYTMNKCDGDGDQVIAEQKIKAQFKDIKNFIHTRCDSGTGLEELKEAIEERLQETGMMNRNFPRAWVNLKDKLQTLARVEPYIPYFKYLELFEQEVGLNAFDQEQINELENDLQRRRNLGQSHLGDYLNDFFNKFHYSTILAYCQDVNREPDWAPLIAKRMILERKADTFVKYLHDAGIILHFPKANSLRNKLILNPDWAGQLAYKIFNSPYHNNGILIESELNKIFADERSNFSIDLLQSYKLCYESKVGKDTVYFIPSLFETRQPENWFSIDNELLIFRYECVFSPIIPADLLSRLIARLSNLIDQTSSLWKHGVLFSRTERQDLLRIGSKESNKNFVQVKEEWQERKLCIKVGGISWRWLLCDVINELYQICKEINEDAVSLKFSFEEKLINLPANKEIDLTAKREENGETLLRPEQLIEADLPADKLAIQSENINVKIQQEEEKFNKSILYISACPVDRTEIRFSEELDSLNRVRETTPKGKFVEIAIKTQVEADELTSILEANRADFVHISVHGRRLGGLLFINNKNQRAAREIDEAEIRDIFEQLANGDKQFELVCFSACHSVRYAQCLAPFFKYTIGMEGAFPVEAAAKFANVFYTNFIDHPIDFAFRQALRAIKRLEIGAQESIEVHEMPKLFVDNKLLNIAI